MKTFTQTFLFCLMMLFCISLSHAQSNGSAIHFNGFDEYIEVPHDASLNMTSGFTIAAWVYLEAYVEWASIVTKGTGDNNYTIHQSGPAGGSDYGHLRFTGSSPNLPIFLESTTKIPLNEWHFVAISYDGTTLTFYYDGNADGGGTLPGPLGTNTESLIIGADFPGAAEYWDGNLDEVRIWNVALSRAQVRAAMHGHANPRANALAAYWRFDEGSGTTVSDRSGNNNTGSFVADPDWISPGAPIGGPSRLGQIDKNGISNYPNPFQHQTAIRFQLSQQTHISLHIYNALGQLVKILGDRPLGPGEHTLIWDGTHMSGELVASGLYFYQLNTGGKLSEIKKMNLQR